MSNVLEIQNKNLLESIALGDRNAEHKLIDKYYKTLFYLLFKQTNDSALSQDLCQDTFVLVLQKARNGEIRNTDAVGAFVRSVGVNLLIEFKRKKTRQKTENSDSVDQFYASHQDNLVGSIEKKQAIKLVHQVIQELSNERDKRLLQDYFLYGKPKSDICQAFDLKAEHFDRVLYRSRQRLKQLLAIKLNLDTSSLSITQIICIAALCGLGASLFTIVKKNENQLRDLATPHHFAYVTELELDGSHSKNCFDCVKVSK